jgi:hypothetical protein
MARLPILLLPAVFAAGLPAQKPLPVDEFEKSELPALHRMHDRPAARELAGLKLTERVAPERVPHWQAQMPGKRASEALTALVDSCAFLDPPGEEAPATPAPDVDGQKQILTRAVGQVAAMLHKLPDFYATRTTTHYETATPQQLLTQQQAFSFQRLSSAYSQGPLPMSTGVVKIPHEELGLIDPLRPALGRLFFITQVEETVTYRDGSEVASSQAGANGDWGGAELGLATRGEFGPILQMVLEDALKRGLTWSHWEQRANGTIAVFHYDVPHEASHFQIVGRAGKPPYYPAYHGELAIDPATGAILRITIQSIGTGDSNNSFDTGILVEYAPVEIGGQMYNCPVHCVAVSREHKSSQAQDGTLAAPATFLNDVAFTGYHLFRGEVRILPSTQ